MTITSPTMTAESLPFTARGPLSAAVFACLTGDPGTDADSDDALSIARTQLADSADIVRDDDIQLTLFLLYASHYGAFPALDPRLEWDADLIRVRTLLEEAFEAELRRRVGEIEVPDARDVPARLFELTSVDAGPSLSRHLAKKATRDQAQEFLIHRSVYTLREADPHSWAIPRLTGRAKAALVEIQSDEYGGGRPERVHATLFARAMRGAGLDDSYGAYIDQVPAVTIASLNAMSLFGLNRRLVGAIVGHLAAFEMTSSIPNRFYAMGLRRVGYGDDVAEYFDEHVEADAVHEQIAGHDLAGALAQDRPDLIPDIMFGASACLAVDGWAGEHIMDCWSAGRSSLRAREQEDVA